MAARMLQFMAKPVSSSGDASQPGLSGAERDAWAELAVAAGREALIAQRGELDNMRTRAVSFAALTVTGSAFLVGTGLNQASRDVTFYVLAILGTTAFVALAVLLVLMVSPWLKFRFLLQPDELMSWMDGKAPAASTTIALRGLARTRLPEMIEANERSLKIIRALYRGVLAVGVATVAIWILIVWIFA